MRAEQMAWRCPQARPVGIAILKDYSFLINKIGAATITPKKDSEVQGILWRCTRICTTTLDIHEGVAQGIYRRHILRVETKQGEKNALTYIANNRAPSRSPARGYLTDFVIKGGREFGLEPDYLEKLYEWQGAHVLKRGPRRPLVKLSQYRQKALAPS